MVRSPRTRSTTERAHRAVTLQQVAEHAGVSIATASRALHGASGRAVGEELRSRVLAAAAELDYVSNAPAQALARSRSSTVGLIVHDITDPYFAELVAGVTRVARESELMVMLAATFRDPQLELEHLRRMRTQRADGLLLAGSGFTEPEFAARLAETLAGFAEEGGRVVCIGGHGVDADLVTVDHRYGAELAVAHLWELGHRRIGVVAGPAGLVTADQRLDGVRRALDARGARLAPRCVAAADFTRDGGHAATLELFTARPDLTAVLALNDCMAAGALSALRDGLGRAVPAEVSVVGFGGLPFTADLHPALTAVRLPVERIGSRAMELLLEPPEHQGARRIVELEVGLTVRASTGPAAG
ncbi:LacI family DNA-binding transcriptional regulator [Kitasatospora sp. NPDC002227]|uniref:LacI family DNA-binding transcriptional regulator n=1 Tax=Kitasatospora sp. NPDC002227 TaxID=3154773 RepID=UPI00332D4AA5